MQCHACMHAYGCACMRMHADHFITYVSDILDLSDLVKQVTSELLHARHYALPAYHSDVRVSKQDASRAVETR